MYNIIFYTGRTWCRIQDNLDTRQQHNKRHKKQNVKSRHFLSKAEILKKKPRKNKEALKALFYMNEQ